MARSLAQHLESLQVQMLRVDVKADEKGLVLAVEVHCQM